MSDILTRLLLDTKDFESKLGKAKGSTNSFASDISGKLVGAVGKFAAGIGVAMGGVEAFNKVVSSSQTAGDRYAETMAGMKRGVDEFFTALGTGDFTAFNSGLDGMVARAREAYRALDQLGNAQMSFDIAQALAQKSIQEGQLAAKNKFAPVDVAKGGFDTWRSGIDEMSARVSQLTLDTQDYIRKAVESAVGVKGFSANMDNITKALLLDIQDKGKRDELKKRYEKEYSEYIEAIRDADDLLRTGSKTEAQRMKDTREYNSIMQELNRKYNEAITVNALLVKYGDDELRAIGGNVKSLIGLDSSISNLKREFNETAYEFNNRNKGTTGFVPIESFDGYTVYSGTSDSSIKKGSVSVGSKSNVAVSGSIAALDAEIKKAQNAYANAASDSARKAALETIRQLQEKKATIEFNVKYNEPKFQAQRGSLASMIAMPQVDKLNPITIESKDVKNTSEYVDNLNAMANVMSALNGITAEGAAGWLSWAASLMTASAQAVESISKVVAAKTAEGAASAGASAASTPVVGWLMVGAAIASALAAFASIPKFAEGGIIGGSSYTGDKLLARVNSGEMILNQGQQARLLRMTEQSNVRVRGDVRLNGKDIYISLRNYMSSSGNRL